MVQLKPGAELAQKTGIAVRTHCFPRRDFCVPRRPRADLEDIVQKDQRKPKGAKSFSSAGERDMDAGDRAATQCHLVRLLPYQQIQAFYVLVYLYMYVYKYI